MAMVLQSSTSDLASSQIKHDICLVSTAKHRVVLASAFVSLSRFGNKNKLMS